MRGLSFIFILTLTGCGSVGQISDSGADAPGTGGGGTGGAGGAGGGGTDAGNTADAPGDSGPAPACSQTSPFGTPVLVPGLSSTTRDDGLSLSTDTLTAYISSFRGPMTTIDNIYTASRSAADQAFANVTLITSLMSGTATDFAPR